MVPSQVFHQIESDQPPTYAQVMANEEKAESNVLPPDFSQITVRNNDTAVEETAWKPSPTLSSNNFSRINELPPDFSEIQGYI